MDTNESKITKISVQTRLAESKDILYLKKTRVLAQFRYKTSFPNYLRWHKKLRQQLTGWLGKN